TGEDRKRRAEQHGKGGPGRLLFRSRRFHPSPAGKGKSGHSVARQVSPRISDARGSAQGASDLPPAVGHHAEGSFPIDGSLAVKGESTASRRKPLPCLLHPPPPRPVDVKSESTARSIDGRAHLPAELEGAA